ncbi:GUN4 domain-containing protein [Planktothrix sp. FACHB-1365]|nr:GUN4 domain-containing protein [Planktothrix sp. FACHB-1365]
MILLDKGRSLEEIQRRGGDDELNLLILEEEEEDREFGFTRERDYKYNVKEEKYIQELAQFLGICHCILVGLLADRYHFSHADVRPKLPELLPSLLEKVPSESLKQMLVGEIVSSYQSLYQLAGCDRPHLIPDLYLDLALSLSHLPDQSWARKQIEYSIQVWLMLRNRVSSIEEQKPGLLELLEAVTSALTVGDKEYVEKLGGCLEAVGESHHQETIQNAIQGQQNTEYQRQLEAERLRQEEEVKRQRQLEEETERLRQSKYQQLEGYLAAARWREADEETVSMMLEVMGKDQYNVSIEDINNFPSEDLRIIDQLWVKYSDGRFGFSVQKRIYQSLGGTREYDEKIWRIFCDRVEWDLYYYTIAIDKHLSRSYQLGWGHWNIQFKYNAPVGHLPSLTRESSHPLFWTTGLLALLSRPDL